MAKLCTMMAYSYSGCCVAWLACLCVAISWLSYGCLYVSALGYIVGSCQSAIINAHWEMRNNIMKRKWNEKKSQLWEIWAPPLMKMIRYTKTKAAAWRRMPERKYLKAARKRRTKNAAKYKVWRLGRSGGWKRENGEAEIERRRKRENRRTNGMKNAILAKRKQSGYICGLGRHLSEESEISKKWNLPSCRRRLKARAIYNLKSWKWNRPGWKQRKKTRLERREELKASWRKDMQRKSSACRRPHWRKLKSLWRRRKYGKCIGLSKSKAMKLKWSIVKS